MQVNSVLSTAQEQRRTVYCDLGLIDYRKAMTLQDRLVAERKSGRGEDMLLMLEHPPVYTIGRAPGAGDQFLVAAEYLKSKHIGIFYSNRGGSITYHGPGQLVCYLVFRLESYNNDVLFFIRLIEQLIIETLDLFGLKAGRNSANSGVWVGNQKIAAIGLGIRSGFTCHGLALNISTDLAMFNYINPCGLTDKGVASMASIMGAAAPAAGEVKKAIVKLFPHVFGSTLVYRPPEVTALNCYPLRPVSGAM